ncbi:unnamed protein product [Arabidopsis halleri]
MAKIDAVHNLLVEDVDYVGGRGFQNQIFEHQQGYKGFYGNGPTSYTQKSQFQQPFQNSSSFSFTRNYDLASYQAPPSTRTKKQDRINAGTDSGRLDIDLQNRSTHIDSVDRQQYQNEEVSTFDGTAPIILEFPPVADQVYTPKVPCSMPQRSKQEIQEERCKDIMDKILPELPLVDIEKLSPPLQRAIILYEGPQKQKEKQKTVVISEQVNAMIQRRIQEKLPDPIAATEKELGTCETTKAAMAKPSAENRSAEMVSIDTTTCVDRHPQRVEPGLSNIVIFQAGITAISPGTTVTSTTAPLLLHPPPKRLRYSSPPPKPPDFINKTLKFSKTVSRLSKPRVSRQALVRSFDDCAGKRSIPPIPKFHPANVPHFLGRSHTPTAYTPP